MKMLTSIKCICATALGSSVVKATCTDSNDSSDTFPPLGNEWIAPSGDDIRSPCPFINTLANHGFVDRSGQDVDLYAMVDSLAANFDLDDSLFVFLADLAVDLGFTTIDAEGTIRMDLDELFAHNLQEHDASFVRADEFFGAEASKLVDLDLLENLLNMNPKSDFLTKTDLMEFQRCRILDSRRNNPDHFFSVEQATGFSAQAILLLVFGQDPVLSCVSKHMLEELLGLERFPSDYQLTSMMTNVIGAGTLANDIRLEFVESFESAIVETDLDDEVQKCQKMFAKNRKKANWL